MIGLVFQLGSEVIEVRIDREQVIFRTPQSPGFATIEGLKLNKVGVIKEHPDLKDNENWQKIAIERFKEKVKRMNTEMERADYVINDLKKFGYKPMYRQRQGFRPEKLK